MWSGQPQGTSISISICIWPRSGHHSRGDDHRMWHARLAFCWPTMGPKSASVAMASHQLCAARGLSAATFFGLRPDGLMPRLMLLSPLLNPVSDGIGQRWRVSFSRGSRAMLVTSSERLGEWKKVT